MNLPKYSDNREAVLVEQEEILKQMKVVCSMNTQNQISKIHLKLHNILNLRPEEKSNNSIEHQRSLALSVIG